MKTKQTKPKKKNKLKIRRKEKRRKETGVINSSEGECISNLNL